MLCIIPTLMVLSFFFNSRILQTGVLQTGPKQFVENQIQNLAATAKVRARLCLARVVERHASACLRTMGVGKGMWRSRLLCI